MKTRRAFTLVEILTVVVIISILAALVTVAVAGAMRAAKRAAIATEMSQVGMAIELHKTSPNGFGVTPPDMFDDSTLVSYVQQRWSRLDWTSIDTFVATTRPGNWGTMTLTQQNAWLIREAISFAYSDVCGGPVDFRSTNHFAPLGALALWLGGFPNGDGRLSGFGADPTNPFDLSFGFDNVVFLDWEVGDGKNVRIIDYGNPNGGVPVIGNEIQSVFVPIVYFRGRSGGGPGAYRLGATGTGPAKQIEFPEFGWCTPYADLENNDGSIRWKNPTTYQLIHPGLDGKFGDTEWDEATTPPTRRIITSGDGIGQWDLDNITNISDYKELRSILP